MKRIMAGLITAAIAAGCASDAAAPDRWRPAEREPLHLAPLQATQPASQPSAADLPTHAGIDAYVHIALQRNPSIRAAEQKARRMEARIAQQRAFDDPMLEVLPFGEPDEVMTRLSQTIPFPGKQDARGSIASAEAAEAVAELMQRKLEVVADVRRAYWSYAFAIRAEQVTRQSRDLLHQFRQIADSRFRAGNGSQADVLRAGVELSEIDNQLITIEQQRISAQAMLNTLLDWPADQALPEPRLMPPGSADLRLDALLTEASQTNPELEMIRRRIDAAHQRQRLARLQYLPDVTLIGSYTVMDEPEMDDGDDEWAVGFGINLPIWWEKYRSGEREAIAGRHEAIAELAGARNRIAFRVTDALSRVRMQQRQAELYRDVILPQARQALESSRASYQAGMVDFLTLVDNWRKLIDFELMHEQALSELNKSLAELEQVVGRQVGSGM